MESLDKIFALKITWRFLFKPLYQDHSIIGYVLGFVFRSLRLMIGGIIYLFVIIIAAAMFIIWAAIPLYIIFKIIDYNPVVNIFKIGI